MTFENQNFLNYQQNQFENPLLNSKHRQLNSLFLINNIHVNENYSTLICKFKKK